MYTESFLQFYIENIIISTVYEETEAQRFK